jgi:hypothetical protein
VGLGLDFSITQHPEGFLEKLVIGIMNHNLKMWGLNLEFAFSKASGGLGALINWADILSNVSQLIK